MLTKEGTKSKRLQVSEDLTRAAEGCGGGFEESVGTSNSCHSASFASEAETSLG